MKSCFWIVAVAVLMGCSAPEYRGSVMSFGVAADKAAKAQSERLSRLNERQIAAVRGQLAAERISLAPAGACAALAIPGSKVKDCVVVRSDGADIAQPETFTSLAALNKAVGAYGNSLSLLAADVAGDAAAFSKSLTSLATSVDGLNATLDGSDSGKTDNAARLAAGATIIGGLGNTFFAGSRVAKLKEIIVETDPQIQQATSLLSRASEALLLAEVSSAIGAANTTRTRLDRAILTGANAEAVGKLQAKLFEEVAVVRQTAAVRDSYAAVGKAHASLVEASVGGASLDDLKASIFELAALVALLDAAVEDL
jgi:hypothetical protein